MDPIAGERRHIGQCIEICLSLSDHFTEDAINRISSDLESGDFWIIEVGNRVVAFSAMDKDPQGRMASILWMGVDKHYQQKGLGRKLVRAMMEEAMKNGMDRMEVRTLAPTVDYEPYEATRRFYEGLGFELMEIIDPYPEWGPENPCAVYSIDLRSF